jgi:hypothetical protein
MKNRTKPDDFASSRTDLAEFVRRWRRRPHGAARRPATAADPFAERTLCKRSTKAF